jgi:cephalosporin-C deacetylase
LPFLCFVIIRYQFIFVGRSHKKLSFKENFIMPVIDMPMDKLREYKGSSPCPEDIDQFWDDALEEMNALDPELELLPAEFQTPFAKCYDMYFTGVGGARIYAKLLRPVAPVKTPHPALVMFHGYSGHSGDWNDKLQYVAAGFTVAALDCRGQGGLSEDVGGVIGNTLKGHIIRGLDSGPEKLYFRSVFLDCAQLTRLVMGMEEVDDTRVGLMGGSQGGALTLACAALVPEVNRAFSAFPFLSDYKRVWDMDLDVHAYEELRTYFRHFDPTHEREDEVFRRLGYIDIQNLAKRIRCNIRMATGLIDQICPPSTQFAVYNKISSEKQHIFYPDFGHEALPGCNDRIYRFMLEMLN